VHKVLFLIPRLHRNGAARQAMLLAAGLPRDRFEVRFVVLGPPLHWAGELRASGIRVDDLGQQRSLDIQAFLRLRSLKREFQPDVIHTWGAAALRAALLVPGVRSGCRVVASAALPPTGRPRRLDRFLLRRGVEVIAFGAGEQRRYAAAGVAPARIHQLRLGVEAGGEVQRAELPIPPGDIVLVVVGPLTPQKGAYNAVWALDILRKVHGHLHLIVTGSGQDRERTEEFAGKIHVLPWAHFTGEVQDIQPFVHRADIAWAPTLAECGRCGVLEAMAAGLPVVASRWPGMEEIVADGVTGFLIEPADQAALARQTRGLIEDAELRHRLGEAGRRRALEEFTVDALVRDAAAVYEGRA
jgi:glycosyltransferase involved in cell wall biosynthesis